MRHWKSRAAVDSSSTDPELAVGCNKVVVAHNKVAEESLGD